MVWSRFTARRLGVQTSTTETVSAERNVKVINFGITCSPLLLLTFFQIPKINSWKAVNGRKWDETTSQTLTKNINCHIIAFGTITEASAHVPHQLPGERMQVESLVDSIVSKDVAICSALANIKINDLVMKENFEKAALWLAPMCPVAKKLVV